LHVEAGILLIGLTNLLVMYFFVASVQGDFSSAGVCDIG
jgi:hypothetical protein